MKICPACGNQYSDDANFCPMDASRLPQAMLTPAIGIPATTTMRDGARSIGGRYLLGPVFAHSPTGDVHEAADGQTGAQVHLKLFAPRAVPTAMLADRALRELKQLAKVRSERIVRVLDQGRTEDGQVYVVTEPASGVPLADLVEREGALSFERARHVVLAVGEALAEAQKVGVIHRDVSPRHVLVAGDRVKLTEFGVAEPIADKIFGTAAFLSPEQAEGRSVDQRSNIYTLGLLFYYSLTGAPPFEGDAPSLIQQHLHSQPKPPSARRPGLTPEIDRLVLKALEKSGGRRHLTMRQMLSEIEALGAPTTLGAAAPRATLPAAEASRPHVAAARPITLPEPVLNESPPREVTEREVPAVYEPPGSPARSPAATLPMSALTADGEVRAPAAASAGAPAAASVTDLRAPLAAAATPDTGKAHVGARRVEPATPAPSDSAQPHGSAPPPRDDGASPRPSATAPAPAAPVMAAAASGSGRTGVRTSATAITVMGAAPVLPVAAADKGAAPPASAARPAGKSQPQQPAPTTPQRPVKPGRRGGFRETAWFKKGELEEQAAKDVTVNPQDPLGGPSAPPEVAVDDSQLTSEDRARLSLKTGHTQAMPVMKSSAVIPGERMSDADLLAEVDSSRRWMLLGGVVVAALAVAVVIYYFFFHASAGS